MLNIPNTLTVIRLCLMPVFLAVYFAPIDNARMWAMVVLIVSFATDVLDGYIARNFNQVSDLGKILDPIADKVMQITVLVCLAMYHQSLIWVVVFVLAKDIVLGIGAFIMHKVKKVTAQANWAGKIACFVSLVLSLVLIFPFKQAIPELWVSVLGWVIAAFNGWALVSYSIVFAKVLKGKMHF